jgi:hypothetical protein
MSRSGGSIPLPGSRAKALVTRLTGAFVVPEPVYQPAVPAWLGAVHLRGTPGRYTSAGRAPIELRIWRLPALAQLRPEGAPVPVVGNRLPVLVPTVIPGQPVTSVPSRCSSTSSPWRRAAPPTGRSELHVLAVLEPGSGADAPAARTGVIACTLCLGARWRSSRRFVIGT